MDKAHPVVCRWIFFENLTETFAFIQNWEWHKFCNGGCWRCRTRKFELWGQATESQRPG